MPAELTQGSAVSALIPASLPLTCGQAICRAARQGPGEEQRLVLTQGSSRESKPLLPHLPSHSSHSPHFLRLNEALVSDHQAKEDGDA